MRCTKVFLVPEQGVLRLVLDWRPRFPHLSPASANPAKALGQALVRPVCRAEIPRALTRGLAVGKACAHLIPPCLLGSGQE